MSHVVDLTLDDDDDDAAPPGPVNRGLVTTAETYITAVSSSGMVQTDLFFESWAVDFNLCDPILGWHGQAHKPSGLLREMTTMM